MGSVWSNMIGLAICLITIPARRDSQNTLVSLRNQPLQWSNKDADNPGQHDRKLSVSLDGRLPLYSKAVEWRCGVEYDQLRVKLVLTSASQRKTLLFKDQWWMSTDSLKQWSKLDISWNIFSKQGNAWRYFGRDFAERGEDPCEEGGQITKWSHQIFF